MKLLSKWANILSESKSLEDEAVIVDANILEKLNLELNKAQEQIGLTKVAYDNGLNKEKLLIDKYNTIKQKIDSNIQYATGALEKGNKKLAIQTSKLIADFESELALVEKTKLESSSKLEKLRTAAISAKINVKRIEQRIDVYKSTGIIEENE